MNSLIKLGMDNTLWHFGDSFGCWQSGRTHIGHTTKGYSNYVAEHFKLNHQHRAEESLSNAQIISRIIKEIPNFKGGDFILINWSFFDRFPVMTEPHGRGRIISLNSLITKEVEGVLDESYSKEYLDYNILDRTNFQKEEWNLLFWLFLKPTIQTLNKLGCKVFVTFNNTVFGDKVIDVRQVALNGCDISAENEHYKLEMIILTEDYIRDLHNNQWYSDDENCVHYKSGIQKELGDWWIERIEYRLPKKIL